MNAERKQSSKGQILVMFALGLIGLLAVGALVVDGGQTFVHRRQAQAAADAGAMAGAYKFCGGSSSTDAITEAMNYATVNNLADPDLTNAYIETVTIDGKSYQRMRVDAVIPQTSFLAQVLGFNNGNIPATASAGCFTPRSGSGVLPVAWSCRTPIGASSSTDCAIQQLDWNTELLPAINACVAAGNNTHSKMAQCLYPKFKGKLYMIMDDLNTPLDHCISSGGTLNCNTDGIAGDDIQYDGQRSWLNLDGHSPSASEIKTIIKEGYPDPIYIHTWYPGTTGLMDVAFDHVDTYLVGKVALLPVINAVCPTDPATTAVCLANAHTPPTGLPLEPGEVDGYVYGGGPDLWGHVAGYATLYVSCETKKMGDCPGHDLSYAAGWYKKNTKSIEGYFVKGYPVDLTNPSSGGLDLNLFFPSLTE